MFCQLVGVLLCSVVGVLAAPAGTEVVPLEKQQPTVIPIVSQSEELESNGTYKFRYVSKYKCRLHDPLII